VLVDPGSVNWWAVLAAAVVGYACTAALGRTGGRPGSSAKTIAAQFPLTLVIAAVLALVVVRFGAVNWKEGAAIGFVLAAGLVATSALSDWIFCGLPMKLYAIQAGCKLVCITAMGAILGAWR
jgi:uncharacterized protein DUF1761